MEYGSTGARRGHPETSPNAVPHSPGSRRAEWHVESGAAQGIPRGRRNPRLRSYGFPISGRECGPCLWRRPAGGPARRGCGSPRCRARSGTPCGPRAGPFRRIRPSPSGMTRPSPPPAGPAPSADVRVPWHRPRAAARTGTTPGARSPSAGPAAWAPHRYAHGWPAAVAWRTSSYDPTATPPGAGRDRHRLPERRRTPRGAGNGEEFYDPRLHPRGPRLPRNSSARTERRRLPCEKEPRAAGRGGFQGPEEFLQGGPGGARGRLARK